MIIVGKENSRNGEGRSKEIHYFVEYVNGLDLSRELIIKEKIHYFIELYNYLFQWKNEHGNTTSRKIASAKTHQQMIDSKNFC